MPLLNERQCVIASYLIMTISLLMILPLHLLPGLLSGLLVYALVTSLSPYVERFSNRKYGRVTVVALFSVVIISLLVLLMVSLSAYVVHDLRGGGLAEVNANLDALLKKFQSEVGGYFPGFVPESIDEMKDTLLRLSKEHLITLQHAGTDVLHGFVTMIVGMILGALISLHPNQNEKDMPIFRRVFLQRLDTLYRAFKNIVFAQVKISLINTILSGLFIFIALPLMGMHLPFGKTLVILTFVFGLLPVIGNLMSNTLIVLSAMSVSFTTAAIALLYLVLIHKLEYFLNADIIGQRINAKAWELLIAMLVFQAVFGLIGLVAAPIYYAYFKSEMKKAELI
ncbi:AI-2E family transporter [Acinetobacter soli]|uniref:AI-2E family transporter n=1 Tax=Acinetobacter soli TaxID=487316 RepID=UPI000CE2CEE0|nr:AI-2E family transporter [Acinetobacter soli]PPB88178.1 hypothetical protein AsoHEU7_01550 [Acinetobacter soli]WEI12917.1 AI-2E family transporter [Acinetobacter soli]WEI14610.1 AI-2E family transporter [Acinetobacter soli]